MVCPGFDRISFDGISFMGFLSTGEQEDFSKSGFFRQENRRTGGFLICGRSTAGDALS